MLLQIGAASFCYKLGQELLQIWAAFFIKNWGKCYYKLGQLNYYYKLEQVLLQIRAAYKLGQQLLQTGAATKNWGNLYYKLGHNKGFCAAYLQN